LFIVQKGEVTLFEETSKKKLRVLHKGDSFGEVGFFTGRQRACSISSHGFSRIYKIRREVFLEVIKENQKELVWLILVVSKRSIPSKTASSTKTTTSRPHLNATFAENDPTFCCSVRL
jgi:CRP-like cAMP-binding protein